jgi:trehalose 6-phosphate phosphatase
MTADSSRHAEALVGAVLSVTPAGFVTDLDGTLAPIVADPAAAAPVPGATHALRALARRIAVVAVVTGRGAVDARRILGPGGDELLVVGNHGLEWLAPGSATPTAPVRAAELRAALAAALDRVPELDGVAVDDKGLSATVHYRGAADGTAARAALLAGLRDLPPGIELREGRRSIELRPVGAGDKGSAVEEIAARHRLQGLVVAGDDVTDLDMFRVAAALKRRGHVTLALAVAGGREVPAAVSDAADLTLESPAQLVGLLARVARGLPKLPRQPD